MHEPIKPMKTNRGCSLLLTLLLSGAALSQSSAQVVYVRTDNNGGLTLRSVNADGTGDTALGLPFPKVTTPAFSRDGRLLAVTAADPARPSLVSLNTWAVDLATGGTTQVTHFEDTFDEKKGYTITVALYKAFSPDNAQLAVNSYIQQDYPTTGFKQTVPILQLFPSDGGPGPTATLHVGNPRDETHHDGEGVDWSSKNVIAAPFKWDAPLDSGLDATYGKGEDTAIYLINPANGSATQLTRPHADVIFSGGSFAGVFSEHDYAPKFSPDGNQLAYVRSLQVSTGAGPEKDVQSLRIIDVNTGADRQVIQFQKGLYVSRVDWSADGTQLVFDLGPQSAPGGFPIQFADPAANAVSVIGADGKNPHQIVAPAAGSPAWRPTVAAAPTVFGNIATRMKVGAGENVLIGGFIITGNQPKKVMIRALGPSLAAAGVQAPLIDPLLELHQGNTVVVTNDNWKQAANTAEIPNGFAPADDRESVLVTTLAPGSYTAIARGAKGETGIGLVEIYDLTGGSAAKLANISTRGFVATGDDVMIGGFIVIGSSGNAKVIVRAIGPSLGASGIQGALQDPTLELHNGNGATLASNDDWQSDLNATQVQAAGVAPQDSRESAIFASLPAGNYTAVVRGKTNSTGVAVVEAYNLQQ